jgi:hypothetical protein
MLVEKFSRLLCIQPQSNNGMHPTADTLPVINLNHAGRRVMPGVRCFAHSGGLCRITASQRA